MLPCVGTHTSRKAFNQDDWYEDNKRVEIKRSWVLTIYMEKNRNSGWKIKAAFRVESFRKYEM